MMRNKLFRRVTAIFLCFLILIPNTLTTFAANWNGGSVDTGVGNTGASTGGFSIDSKWDGAENEILGLRFSYYNVKTGETKGTTIDVFRSTYSSYMSYNKVSEKYNKPELIAVHQSSTTLDSTTSTADSYADNNARLTALGLTSLPSSTSGLEAWQNKNENINALLSTMNISGVTDIDKMGEDDYLLVEPIYPVQLAGAWYVLTVTEMAVLGSQPAIHHVDINGDGVYDSNYNGTWSQGTSANWQNTWQWINNFTNRAFPNALHLTETWKDSDGNTVLAAAPADHTDSGWYTFDEIINNGLGMGIAWTNS